MTVMCLCVGGTLGVCLLACMHVHACLAAGLIPRKELMNRLLSDMLMLLSWCQELRYCLSSLCCELRFLITDENLLRIASVLLHLMSGLGNCQKAAVVLSLLPPTPIVSIALYVQHCKVGVGYYRYNMFGYVTIESDLDQHCTLMITDSFARSLKSTLQTIFSAMWIFVFQNDHS